MGDCTANQLMENLHIMMNLVRRKMHRHRAEEKGKLFSFGQYRVMSVLIDKDWMNQRDLCEILDIRSGSLSELLNKLEEAGMIARRSSQEDRRSMDLRLTEKGRVTSQQAETNRMQLEAHVFDALSPEEQETLCALLQKTITGLQAETGLDRSDCAHLQMKPPGRNGHEQH